MIERNGGIAEYTEYSEIRKIWNILKTENMEYFETRNIRNILKHGIYGIF